jgi:hypothetical protein
MGRTSIRHYPIKHRLELHTVTSQIFGDNRLGFKNNREYLGGVGFYIAQSCNLRIKVLAMNMSHLPVSSTFGYYVGGQKGTTVSIGTSIFF